MSFIQPIVFEWSQTIKLETREASAHGRSIVLEMERPWQDSNCDPTARGVFSTFEVMLLCGT